MPKALNCKGLIPFKDVQQRVLQHVGLDEDPIAQQRTRPRRLRGIFERRPELAVWIGVRLYTPDEPRALDALADETGVLQPPVTAPPSNMDAAT